jgi:hypothetical protein
VKKIPTYFERDWNGDRSRVVPEINAACRWVADGEGWATRKMDGACAMIRGGKLFKRRELKTGQGQPDGFEYADHDEETGKTVGWVPVGGAPEDRWFREAMSRWVESGLPIQEGTYELVGPKVNGNPEGRAVHGLVYHGGRGLVLDPQPPRTFAGLLAWMAGQDVEGVVWHHPDGRMAKLKLRDFGLKRPAVASREAESRRDRWPVTNPGISSESIRKPGG